MQDIPLGEKILGRDPNGHVRRVFRVFIRLALEGFIAAAWYRGVVLHEDIVDHSEGLHGI